MILRISYKEIEEIFSSEVIIMEGEPVNAINTVGIEGQTGQNYYKYSYLRA